MSAAREENRRIREAARAQALTDRTCPEMVWEGLGEAGSPAVTVDEIVRGSGVMVDGRPCVSRGTALRYLKLWSLAGLVRLEGRGAGAAASKLVAGRTPRVFFDGSTSRFADPRDEDRYFTVRAPLARGEAPEVIHAERVPGAAHRVLSRSAPS